jgi:hypothetical protein
MAGMENLVTYGLLDEVNGIALMGYTSAFGSVEQPLANALTYCQTHFPGITGCTGKWLPAGAAGVPWGGVIDLETMEVIAMENDDAYIDFSYNTAYYAMKAANED